VLAWHTTFRSSRSQFTRSDLGELPRPRAHSERRRCRWDRHPRSPPL